MATATTNETCPHLKHAWCDDCVADLRRELRHAKTDAEEAEKKIEDLEHRVKVMARELDDVERTNKEADALDAMLPEEGYQGAPPGCKIEVVRYDSPPACQVRFTLPDGSREAVELKDLPAKYAALLAGAKR
jgi:hypothetical protein